MMNYSRNMNQRFRTALITVIFAVILVVITCTLLGMATPTSGTDKTAETDTHTHTHTHTDIFLHPFHRADNPGSEGTGNHQSW